MVFFLKLSNKSRQKLCKLVEKAVYFVIDVHLELQIVFGKDFAKMTSIFLLTCAHNVVEIDDFGLFKFFQTLKQNSFSKINLVVFPCFGS